MSEVLQSGVDAYTVFLVDRREYARELRKRPNGDLADELLELARRAHQTVSDARRRRKYRDYMP